MNQKKLLSKLPTKAILELLNARKNVSCNPQKNLLSFTQLLKATKLSRSQLTEYLKMLQLQKMIEKDVLTRHYKIREKGCDWLNKDNVAETIKKDGIVVKAIDNLPPVNSIVAIDVSNITSQQQQHIMAGTKRTAEACFNRIYVDSLQTMGKFPNNGRVTYTVSLDLEEVSQWLDSPAGKEYIDKNSEELSIVNYNITKPGTTISKE